MEVIIDEEKKVKHSVLSEQAEDVFMKPSKVKSKVLNSTAMVYARVVVCNVPDEGMECVGVGARILCDTKLLELVVQTIQ